MHSAQFQLHAEIEERHWWFVARRRILADLIHETLAPSQATTIVDVGCGAGANIASLAHDYRAVGIDTSEEAIELARRRFPNVKFVRGFAPRDIADELAQARLVMMTDVVEHVCDDFALFSSLLAATRPGTYFLLTVPADVSLWSEHDESFGHYRRYDIDRFARLWAGLPVTPLVTSYYNTRLYPLVKLVRNASRSRGKAYGKAGTDFNIPPRPLNWLLTRVFAGESRRLIAQARGKSRPYRRGVSLVALLRREPGTIDAREKPADVGADLFEAGQRVAALA